MRKLTIEELSRINIKDYKSVEKIPVTVILDNIRSTYNVGSIFRTADAFRIEKIILCGITATPEKSLVEIHKTALGAEESVEWSYEKNIMCTINELKNNGYLIVSVEQISESVKLDDFSEVNSNKYALVFGNEVNGVSQEVVDISDMALEIPQYGTKHSLNVAVSAGIVMYKFVTLYHEQCVGGHCL